MKSILLTLAIAVGIAAASSTAFARTEAVCTMQYQPVCGAKQVQCIKAPCYPVYETYGNSCMLSAEGATFIHEGECTAAESGPVKTEESPYIPPKSCTAWFDGCNQCGRTANGDSFCTLMACEAPLPAGYCTKYEEQPTPIPSAPVDEPVSTSTTATSSSPEPTEPGFLYTLWSRILNWFNWF